MSTETKPIKVLFLAANPDTASNLRFDKEIRAIQDGLRSANLSRVLTVVPLHAVAAQDLQDALIEHEPEIVHFSGHGTAHGELLLDDPRGAAVRAPKDALVELFALLGGSVRVVVLNACFSAAVAEPIARHVGCALGTTQAIKDAAAIDFAETFYVNIARGRSVGGALALARNRISLGGHDRKDAAQVFTREGVNEDMLVLVEQTSGDKVARALLKPSRLLLLADLASDNRTPEAELLAAIGDPGVAKTLRATEFGAASAPGGRVDDYEACADAIHRMVVAARANAPGNTDVRFYVAGRGALPIFVHLGMELSDWADVIAVNRRRGGAWDVLSLDSATVANAPPFFERRRGLAEPSDASGHVAVFIASGHQLPPDQIRSLIKERGEEIAGIVELSTDKLLDETNAPQTMRELREVFTRQIRALYPHRSGVALFVAGPTPLALMVGRAINKNVLKDVWVANYDGAAYRFALELPFQPRARRRIEHSPQDELARGRILEELRRAVDALKKKLAPTHLPATLRETEGERFLKRLGTIEIAPEPEGDAFTIDVSERTMTLGHGLLEALRKVADAEERARIGQALLLHELYHFTQGLPSATFRDVGRAGFALEEVDFWADAVAVGALASMEIQRRGDEGRERARDIVIAHIDALLSGIEAFDRAEHDERKIDALPERRLRRYLIWSLQRTRALTLQRFEDLAQLLAQRLVVELAPLKGHLDPRWDKIVDGPIRETELFVVLGGRLLRIPSQAGFDPAAIVDGIRSFQRQPVREAMKFVREQHLRVLAPWVS